MLKISRPPPFLYAILTVRKQSADFFLQGGCNENFYILTDALAYIEKNICEDIDSQSVADSCGVSLSSLQKLFRLALNKSVKDYILRRRICLAAKKVDISEAYDEIVKRQGTYVICFDIVGLIPINEIAREAGDLAILEAARRIDSVSTEEMMQLRIGGDEFALITGSDDEEEVKKLTEQVLSHNGEPVEYKGRKIPLNIRAGVIKVPGEGVRYSEFFMEMHEAINETKRKEK